MAYTTIDKPSDYFNTITYTGDGTSPRTITGVGFDPDFVWGKRRDDAAGHNLFDRVRGAGSTKNLQSNGTSAEGGGLPGTYGYINAFATDGFTVTTGSTDNAYWNNNTATYVAWNWLAGGTASSNTDGSVTSSVSVNTTAGFSVGTYTSPASASTAFTVGHGLGVAPKMYWVKTRDSTGGGWTVYNNNLGANKYLFLDTAAAPGTNTLAHNNTHPTTSVFSQNTGWAGTSRSYVYYAFAEIKGYSKIGSYTGNNSSDGVFTYLGFKPAMVIIKDTTSTDPWHIIDNKRSPRNLMNARLFPNTSGAENTSADICDFVSNGIKFRGTNDGFNGSRTYIYYAVAESPFTTSTGIPTTAR